MEASRDDTAAPQPSVIGVLVVALTTMVILEQHSRLPEANVIVVLFCSLATLGLGVAYLARIANWSKTGYRMEYGPRGIFNWIAFPAAVTLMLSSVVTHWPAIIRFHFSKPSFEKLVATVYEGQELDGFPRRVGLYWIDEVQDAGFNYETREGTVGFVTGVALIDECGIYYDEQDGRSTHYLTTRIAPHWYLTEW